MSAPSFSTRKEHSSEKEDGEHHSSSRGTAQRAAFTATTFQFAVTRGPLHRRLLNLHLDFMLLGAENFCGFLSWGTI